MEKNLIQGKFVQHPIRTVPLRHSADFSVVQFFCALQSPAFRGTITHKGAVEAKPMIQYVRNVLNQSNWSKYAEKSMKNAARYSAMVLYKFGRESVVPFYSN